MSQGYAVTNALTGLAASAFTWSSGYTTSRTRLNDGILDEPAASAASAQASGQTLKIDLGSAQTLLGFALLNHNLASGSCTVQVEAATLSNYSDAVTVKAATTIVTTAPNHKDTILQFPPAQPSIAWRYWRLTFVHMGTKIVTIGELLAFTGITTLTRHTIYGDGESERAILNRVVSGTGHQRATYLGGPVRTKRLIYKDLSTSELAELRAMWAATTYGTANLLWIEFIESTAAAATAAAQECLWGKIEDTFEWTQDDYHLYAPNPYNIVGQGREVGS